MESVSRREQLANRIAAKMDPPVSETARAYLFSMILAFIDIVGPDNFVTDEHWVTDVSR